jgi:hypothetical protein
VRGGAGGLPATACRRARTLVRSADDVGEKHRREHSIHIDEIPFTALPDTAEKARDLPCDLLWIDEPRVVFPLELDKLRFGIASAIARPSAMSTSRSPRRWSTRVGERIAERTWLASISTFIRCRSAAARGLALVRAYRRHQRRSSASRARLGECIQQPVQILVRSPPSFALCDCAKPLVPRLLRLRHEVRLRAEEDRCGGPFWIGRREEQRHRTALRHSRRCRLRQQQARGRAGGARGRPARASQGRLRRRGCRRCQDADRARADGHVRGRAGRGQRQGIAAGMRVGVPK